MDKLTRRKRRLLRLGQLPAFMVLDIRKAITESRGRNGTKERICEIIRYNDTSYSIEEYERNKFHLYRINTEILKEEYTRGYKSPYRTKLIDFEVSELWQI